MQVEPRARTGDIGNACKVVVTKHHGNKLPGIHVCKHIDRGIILKWLLEMLVVKI
jgi:hypothetical protein